MTIPFFPSHLFLRYPLHQKARLFGRRPEFLYALLIDHFWYIEWQFSARYLKVPFSLALFKKSLLHAQLAA
jgi:hypothetical protein